MTADAIYLDHAAGPVLDPRVRAAMADALAWHASPSAVHEAARAPAEALAAARAEVAALIGADDPDEVILTAGATEARNLAVKGIASANADLGRTIVLSPLEHPATIAAAHTAGDPVEVAVGAEGHVDPERLAAALGAEVALVCLHHGQEEIGTIQDVAALVAAVRGARADARIVLDAAATAGLLPLDVAALGVDAVVIGGPSLGAPAWTGALWVRPGARIHPLIEGGAQEGGKRAGAEPLPGVVALGTAAGIARAEGAERAARMTRSAERLAAALARIPDARPSGPRTPRVPGNVHLALAGVRGDTLAVALGARGVQLSPGSTCTAAAGRPSPALEALGLGPEWTRGAILASTGPGTRDDEIDRAAAIVAEEAARLRALAPAGA